ncbi:spermidine/putrescine ABC transporter substrate-binding protein [Marinomonas sp. CT5]|uniref:extracellular solute-binding protein n=1 Tax=Marinomonas sp. CT5 TaxID=2066133 RepID=UPI0017F3E453|nr:extracellular solute-binding protein [Marinomonas sp. CT5]NVK74182.1 extracellular solute-binding protein [Oceanospirillaceae bacterium]QUX97170.1 spermidine/putrescine ABC transporter substrate-binding protein [Marinomonas sp. CT5]
MKYFKTALTAAVIASSLPLSVQAAGSLNIYAWAESIKPELISQFESETGIKVVFDSYTSNEDLLAKLKSGTTNYDLVSPSQHFVDIMIKEGLLENIHANEMPAFKHVDKQWQHQWWDKTSEYSIPFAYGSAGYTVNRDLYDGPATSWKEFFEPTEALKGKIAVFSTPDEVIPAAQLYLDIPFCSEDSKEMKRVLDLLKKQKPYVAVYSSDNIGSRIGGGEVAMHNWWDGNSMKARRVDGAPIEYAQPKEGLVGWMDSLVVPKGASNVKNAKAFINWISEKEHATEQANYYGHSPAVAVDLSKSINTQENAPELFPTVPVVMAQACSPKAQKLVDRVWTALLE